MAQIIDSSGLKVIFKIIYNSQTITAIITPEPYPYMPHPDTVGLQPNIVQESQHSWGIILGRSPNSERKPCHGESAFPSDGTLSSECGLLYKAPLKEERNTPILSLWS